MIDFIAPSYFKFSGKHLLRGSSLFVGNIQCLAMAKYSCCVDKNQLTQEMYDTDHFIGNNHTTMVINTQNNVSPKIRSEEITDLDTPVPCNRVDNTVDLDQERSNNEISDRLQIDFNLLDINKNSPGIKIDISEDCAAGTVDHNDGNEKVTFGLHPDEESDISPESEETIIDDSTLKMDENVFREEALTKAKSDTHLDNYVSSKNSKVRKLSPGDLASPSSTSNLGAGINSGLRCRRKHSSGSDVGSKSGLPSEEIFSSEDEITDEEQPPCDCDECLFNPVEERPKPPPEERKVARKVQHWLQNNALFNNYEP